MDLRSMLNDDTGDAHAKNARPPIEGQTRPSPVPPLQMQTSRDTPGGSAYDSPTGRPSSAYQNSPASYARPSLEHRSSSQSFGHSSNNGYPQSPYTPAPASATGVSNGYFSQQYQSPPRTQSSSHIPPTQYPQTALSGPPNQSFPPPYPHAQTRSSFGPPLHETVRSPLNGSAGHKYPPRPQAQLLRHESSGSASTSASYNNIGPVSRQPSLYSNPPVSTNSPVRPKSSGIDHVITHGRDSQSVSPKTLPVEVPGVQADRSAPSLPAPGTSTGVVVDDSAMAGITAQSGEQMLQQGRNSNPGVKDSPKNLSLVSAQSTQQTRVNDIQTPTSTDFDLSNMAPTNQKRAFNSSSPASAVKTEPQPKRRKVQEIPRWARPAKQLRLLTKLSLVANGATRDERTMTNGEVPARFKPKAPVTHSDARVDGHLGYFEKTFHGDIEPHEDLTRRVCDWLFIQVVMNNALQTGGGDETSKTEGQLEIEAKIGSILDARTGDRLKLPITTEALLSDSVDIGFESMMTMQQHKMFNDLLNEALKDSMGAGTSRQSNPDQTSKPRVKMVYQHKYEIDSFYAISESELQTFSAPVKALIKNGRRKAVVRVTRDQRTGEILAKVIKSRIADLHVYNPGYNFDYRISVNLEADWSGDVQALMDAANARGDVNPKPDRYKDRVSYRHSFCQIDLTQVKPDSKAGNQSATHELEVELDSDAVKTQGKLVQENNPNNQYQELVKTFLDNARLLVRAGGRLSA